jgi:formiminotetrahydrofolate cyclodeaminase
MQDVSAWLDEMARRPLPGGVAAAALAGAMGAALLAKAARVARRHSAPDDGAMAGDTMQALPASAARAGAQQRRLLRLCGADSEAYRRAIAGEGRGAWQVAVDVPLQVAEAAACVRADVAAVRCHAGPAVAVDLDIAARLLEVAYFAGQLAARENLGHIEPGPAADALAARLTSLTQEVEA